MGLVLRQIVVDDDWLRRVVEVVLDLFDLRDSGELRDIQRAILEGQAVRPTHPEGWYETHRSIFMSVKLK